ncbi:MAG: ABC transporter ATP-binding protein [Paracoccaceae bacterium]
MLELKNLTKRFDATAAVNDVSLSVPDGAFLVLLGPSGCGKTTLLRMLAGLELPTSGQIIFDGKVVSDGDRHWQVDPARRNSGLVFQSYALWPHMTVRGNVDWPLKVAGMPAPDRTTRVDEVLKMLDIAPLANRYPNEISGGQQQRVAIARTIAPKPGVLLFDEPLSNLDAKLRVEMRTELMRLHRATGAAAVYVTHDQIEAMTMATHVAVINKGRIEQFGSPQSLIDHPATAFVATFVGTPPNNIVPVVKTTTGTHAGGRHMDLSPPTDDCLAMFRADTLHLTDTEGPRTLRMELVEVSTIAGRTMATALAGGLRLTAVLDRPPLARIGEAVHVDLPASPAAWFTPNGERIV